MILQRYSDFRKAFSVPGAGRDPSGYELWPASLVLYGPDEAFFLTMPESVTTVAEIMATGSADGEPGVDEFDWYLCQRTDAPERQALKLLRSDLGEVTRSGTVQLIPTAFATARYGVTMQDPVPSPEDAILIFRDVTLFVRRRSDGKVRLGVFPLPEAV